mgnify:CR=1 FL=1
MEFVIIIIVVLAFMFILKFVYDYNLKKIKESVKNEKLDKITKKYPSNKEICEWYLNKLNNKGVKIEEAPNATASLYIAISNKIVIANITDNYARIQTLAHECLHSIQNKKMLIFNFIFSNIYMVYFIAICILQILALLPAQMMFLSIFLILSLVYYCIRVYLENDAMLNAPYLAKEYMENAKISSQDEINEIFEEYKKITKIGTKCIAYNFFLGIIAKTLIFSALCFIL